MMFLNKDLDLLGANPEGYKVEHGRAILNVFFGGELYYCLLYFHFGNIVFGKNCWYMFRLFYLVSSLRR